MSLKVSITRSDAYGEEEVYASIKDAVDLLGGISLFVKRGERILLKPNLLAGKPPEAAVTTHPSAIKAVIRLVKEAGGVPLVGDSPGLGGPRKTAEKCGVLRVCEETGAEFVEFKEMVIAENPEGHTFKRLEVAKEALGADGIINIPKLKTHAQMYLTLGVKNLFGCVPGKRKAQWHLSAGVESSHFADMLLDLSIFLNPRLTIIDGIVGMEGNGPGSGDPRHLGLVFAGSDPVAVDTAVALVLGAKPEDMPINRAARRRGMDAAYASKIEVLGKDPDRIKVSGFRFPPLISTNFLEKLPYAISKRLRKSLTSSPDIDRKDCTLCGVCVEACPPGVMTKADRIIIDYGKCIRCYCCQEMCPHGAISAKDGFLKKLIPGL